MNRTLTAVVTFVAVFLVVFGIGNYYTYPEDKESIFIKTDGWPIEIRHMEVRTGGQDRSQPVLVLWNSPTTPVEFDFEFNGRTTDIGHSGVFIKPIWVDKKTIMEMATAENDKKIQRFFVGDVRVCVMYIVLLDDKVYYTVEKICNKPGFFYTMSAESVDGIMVIHQHPDTAVFYIVLTIISGIIAALFTVGAECFKRESLIIEN